MIQTIQDFDFFQKKVILRLDWNVPTKDRKILDTNRIVSSLPTIKKILKDNPKHIVIISHFGRPKGKDKKYSFSNYLSEINQLFYDNDILTRDKNIHFLEDGLDSRTIEILEKEESQVYLLENIRFHDIETEYENMNKIKENIENIENIEIEIIQQLGDVFVNDAFGCLHRRHLTICGIVNKPKCIGYLVEKEIENLKLITENKCGKVLAIIGGGKMDDKIPLIKKLSNVVDSIYICGGNINSIVKNNIKGLDMKEFVKNLDDFDVKACSYYMRDGIFSKDLVSSEYPKYSDNINELPFDQYFFDIGMKSIFDLYEIIKDHDIIFWNGTLGVVENDLYKQGSVMLVDLLIKMTNLGKKVIIGGGDTGGFVSKFKHNFHYITTGGGASIEYISNGSLVGLDYMKE